MPALGGTAACCMLNLSRLDTPAVPEEAMDTARLSARSALMPFMLVRCVAELIMQRQGCQPSGIWVCVYCCVFSVPVFSGTGTEYTAPMTERIAVVQKRFRSHGSILSAFPCGQ